MPFVIKGGHFSRKRSGRPHTVCRRSTDHIDFAAHVDDIYHRGLEHRPRPYFDLDEPFEKEKIIWMIRNVKELVHIPGAYKNEFNHSE